MAVTISLCMIVKNEEKTLARCLNSVKGIADEIIVVDTGSADGTKRAAAALPAKYSTSRGATIFPPRGTFPLKKRAAIISCGWTPTT